MEVLDYFDEWSRTLIALISQPPISTTRHVSSARHTMDWLKIISARETLLPHPILVFLGHLPWTYVANKAWKLFYANWSPFQVEQWLMNFSSLAKYWIAPSRTSCHVLWSEVDSDFSSIQLSVGEVQDSQRSDRRRYQASGRANCGASGWKTTSPNNNQEMPETQ